MNISELYKGRPTKDDSLHREDKEIRTYDMLDRLGIVYERLDHDEAMSIDVSHEIDEKLDAVISKNLFLCNNKKTDFYLVVLPGHKRIVTKEVSKKVNSSRLSFAKPEYMEEYLDITPGSVSIMGLMNDKEKKVHLLMDKEIYDSEYIGCHPCINTSSLRIKTKDILDIFLKETGHEPMVIEV